VEHDFGRDMKETIAEISGKVEGGIEVRGPIAEMQR
jgi:hypothetical protein